MVLRKVNANSAADKAGLKTNDILLELDGKPVPSERNAFIKTLNDIKADQKVAALVLRKGQKVTVKDLALPEAKRFPDNRFPVPPVPPVPPRPPLPPLNPAGVLPPNPSGNLPPAPPAPK